MTAIEASYMGENPQGPNERLGDYLRRQYPPVGAVKLLAAELNCTPKAAENMLANHWPGARHWSAIAARFGRDVLDAVFAPDIDATAAKLAQECAALEQQLEEKRARARQVAGVVPRLAEVRAQPENRAAVDR